MKFKGIPIKEISLFKTPLIYLELTAYILKDLILWFGKFFVEKIVFIIVLAFIYLMISLVGFLHPVYQFFWFAVYWILLGVASSIGLGTGLHTFVLYLGPHIAKLAMVATTCGSIPQMLPSRWNFEHFGTCNHIESQTIGFFGILLAVQIESFLWGFGTALGELPPYFVAKKAAQTQLQLRRMNDQGEKKQEQQEQKLCEKDDQDAAQPIPKQNKQNDEISEVQLLKKKPNPTFMDKAKIIIYDNMQKYGFLTILLCASIPNPLFDLAGITCGHFRIPFKTFFSATFIGKAIIKVHIQMLFVIALFRKQTVEMIIDVVKYFNTGIAQSIAHTMENQRKLLHEPATYHENKPLIAKLWDIFIILMVGYFVLSIMDNQVHEKAIQMKDQK